MGMYLPDINLRSLNTVSKIILGESFICALRIDTILICFGVNDHGQLGIGSITTVSIMKSNYLTNHL